MPLPCLPTATVESQGQRGYSSRHEGGGGSRAPGSMLGGESHRPLWPVADTSAAERRRRRVAGDFRAALSVAGPVVDSSLCRQWRGGRRSRVPPPPFRPPPSLLCKANTLSI